MFSRVFNRVGRSAAAKPARTQCRKTSSHAKAPYEPHHEPSIYGNTPLPFGVGPNYKFEGWEVPVIVTYALVAGMFVYAELIDTDNETPMVRITLSCVSSVYISYVVYVWIVVF